MPGFSASGPDFRRTGKGNIRHKLRDILTLMILARLCGHTVRADIIGFGRFKLGRLRKLGILENGVPSEPTLCRVEKGMDDTLMAKATEPCQEKSNEIKAMPLLARNLDTVQRTVHAGFSIWRGRRRRLADRAEGIAELKRYISFGFTRLIRFLGRK